MANVSTGFSIGIVKLSHTQSVAKTMLVQGLAFHGLAATTSAGVYDGAGHEIWHPVGYYQEIQFAHPRRFGTLSATALAANCHLYVYLA